MNDFLLPELLHQPTLQEELPFYFEIKNECQIFDFAHQQGLPLLIKGPTGCGKTRFISHMAARLGRPLTTVACHDDLSAADLVGRHLIGDGQTIWSDGPLTRAVREGGICYLDEVVEARKDTTVVLHPLTDDRRMLPLERTGELLMAPREFMLVASYNPGYQNLLKNLKPSTRQRFVAIEFTYPDANIEKQIVMQESGVDNDIAQRLVAIATAFRRLQNFHLEESASTRLLIYAGKLMVAGLPPPSACASALAQPLSDDPDTLLALQEIIRLHFGS